jgi:hypothetical protein
MIPDRHVGCLNRPALLRHSDFGHYVCPVVSALLTWHVRNRYGMSCLLGAASPRSPRGTGGK